MEEITRAAIVGKSRGEAVRVGVDLAKRVIQVHAVDTAGHVLTSGALARDKFLGWCAQLSLRRRHRRDGIHGRLLDPLVRAALKQALAAFDFVGTQLAQCDSQIQAQLQTLQAHDGEPAKGKKRGRARNAPKFDLRTQLFKMCGVDLTRIDGIDVTTALAVISETGADMSGFATVQHFTCWLGFCPGTKIGANKLLSGKTKRTANRAAQALRLAAAALRTRQSALGAYFRRMCSRMDKPKAATATAHKLARLTYAMLTKGQEYTDQGQDYYKERYRERVMRQLSQRAQKLGMRLVPPEQAA